MGQRADEVSGPSGSHRSEPETYVVRPGESRFVSAEGVESDRGRDAQPATARHPDDTPETDEIRAEMEATRAEMSHTIDAIQERLAPDELKEQARDAAADMAEQVGAHVREALHDAAESAKQAVRAATIGRAEDFVYTTRDNAREVTFNMMDTIRENPLPAALVGIGLGWLLMNGSKRSHEHDSYSTHRRTPSYPSTYRRNTAYDYPSNYRRSEDYGGYRGYAGYNADYDERERESNGVKGKVADVAGQVQERAGHMMNEAGEMASNVASSASDMAGDVASNAGDMMSNAGEMAMDAGTSLWDTIRRNPIPAAMAGIGLGWLLLNHSGQDEEQRWRTSYPSRGRYAYDYDYGGRYGYDRRRYGAYDTDEEADQGVGGGVADRVGDMADQARETVSSVGERARDRAQQLGNRVSDQMDQLGDQVGDMTDQAQYYVERAQGQLERMVQDNPLAVGAVALAVGAAVGMAVPETRRERELMGDTRDAFMERAQDVVQDATEKVQRVAQEAGSAAQDAAKKEAKDQGLATQPSGSQSSSAPSGSPGSSSSSSGGTSSGQSSSSSGSSGTSSSSGTSYVSTGTGSSPSSGTSHS
ncbi:MAG TPA: DUF3618 domain-containing protein [Chloroflexota bacterium]|nr:DUF3618 domain-containing protein [Chloroflexota bacterium]